MAAANTAILVLLDPNNDHEKLSRNYDSQILSRFTDKGRCILHVLSSLRNARLLHLFIPSIENNLIQARVTLFNKTVFYIYCMDEATVTEMKQVYNYPMFVKIFHVQWLPTYLYQAAMAYLIERAERTMHEPDEYDAALQGAAEMANMLADELNQHMIVQTGVQPDDRI